MKIIRAILALLFLFSIISRASVAAYKKDVSVLSTIYKIYGQNQEPIQAEEAAIERDTKIANYAIAFFATTLFISFSLGKKSVSDGVVK